MPVSRQSVGSPSRPAADSNRPELANQSKQAIAKAVELLSGTELSRARYTFHTDGDPGASWLMSHMQLREGLSSSFAAQINLSSVEGDNPELLLGKGCTLTIERDDSRRELHGIVTRVAVGSLHETGTKADITVVPALQALAQRSDCRIFQDHTIPEVLALVLGPGLQAYGRKHEPRLTRIDYVKHEYLVQYRETDLEFVERLMSEEGIWYYFEHGQSSSADKQGSGADKTELLVLVDTNDGAQRANLGHTGDHLPMQLDLGAKAYWQAVTHFRSERLVSPTSLTVREYNWTNPAVVEEQALGSDPDGPRALFEPFGVSFADYTKPQFGTFDTKNQARVRWEYQQTRAVRAVGRGNVIALQPGQKVSVTGQGPELDGEWLVIAVEAHGRDAKNLEQTAEDLEDYANSFVCARSELPFRPQRLSKPRVHGVQTATVVGPTKLPSYQPGEDDIHTDEHGRIQVKMSWDRTVGAARDETSPPDPKRPLPTVTCYVRVAQGWAGSGWGFMFIPRIGMEVIVSFIDGDSDRPLITGCVYNGLNRAMYDLPKEKTKSYIRTLSTPSGKGFNELQFDDADDQEQIFLHASRDLNEVVVRNEDLSVGGDRSKTVRGNETVHVSKTRSHFVQGDESLEVTDGSSRSLKVSGTETTQITKDRTLTVSAEGKDTENFLGAREVNVEQGDVLNVKGSNKTDTIHGEYNITADKQFQVQQGKDKLVIKDSVFLTSEGGLHFTNKGFDLYADPSGDTTIKIGKTLTLSVGDGKSQIILKGDGTIVVTGETKVTVGTKAGNQLEATQQAVAMSGLKATVNGSTGTEIKGLTVKIN